MVPDPWFSYIARMHVASLLGFIIAAQFLSADLLEHPYYINLLGAGLLKLYSKKPAPQFRLGTPTVRAAAPRKSAAPQGARA